MNYSRITEHFFEYKSDKNPSEEKDSFIQYGYACHTLGIKLTTTSIPETKGKIEQSPELRDTYEIVKKLKRAVRAHNFTRFKQVLVDSKHGLTLRKYVLYTPYLKKYLDSIKNSFKYTHSNGPVEEINNKIKNLKRSGYSYRNFGNLRYRVLISFKLTQKSNKSKAIYYEELKAR